LSALIPPRVRDLLERELTFIAQLKYETYFLTVYDLVRFANSRGILCQGRGSAANSAVCYCLGVTSVDPMKIDLLFERFVSAARNEPPDIDVDFEHERREEVIQYLYEKYGRDRAGMTAEVITYRGRSAVRDVGKALGLSLDLVDSMAKKLDWWHRGTIGPEMLTELGLDPNDRTIRKVVDLTGQLLGFPRHLSQHVGGMVMTRGPLCEMVPIENASMPDRTVIEWDKDDIDAVGILKVDALALGMLTAISKAFAFLNGHSRDEMPDAPRLAATRRASAAQPERERAGADDDGASDEHTPSPEGATKSSPGGEPWGPDETIPIFTPHIQSPEGATDSSVIDPHPSFAPPGLRGDVAPSPQGLRPGLLFAAPPGLPLPRRSVTYQLHTIPNEDPAVYAMISDADTVGVFQIESRAQMSMLPRLKPNCFYDLVIEVAIVRPGPIQGDMVHPYLRRRNKEELVSYPSPALRDVLAKTLGVPLFQEQAMRVAMVGAGFSADEADQLRRAMAAWKRSGAAIEKFHAKIVTGMLANGYTREFAEQCFNQIKGFGEYGFPESHAASFARLVYVSAWIRRHHPAAFCAALLNSQPMGFYAPAQLVRDAKEHGVTVRAIDVNASEWDCTLEEKDEGGRMKDEADAEPRLAATRRASAAPPEGERVGADSANAPFRVCSAHHSRNDDCVAHFHSPDGATKSSPGRKPWVRADAPPTSFHGNSPEGATDGTADRATARHRSFAPPGLGEEPLDAGGAPPSSQGLRPGLLFAAPSGLDTPPPKSTWGIPGPAVRLGFRLIKGLRETFGHRIADARKRVGRFTSIPHFRRATGLPAHAIRRLAEADAFGSLGLPRRIAVWEALSIRDEEMPLFEMLEDDAHPEASAPGRAPQAGRLQDEPTHSNQPAIRDPQSEIPPHPSAPLQSAIGNRQSAIPTPFLPPMPLNQEVLTDYATTTLSLKKHPVELVRDHLASLRIRTAAEVLATENAKWVKVAGLVLIRQRPGTASGIVFETLEDETGVINLIVKPDVFERYRQAARHASLLQCDGYVQRQGQVVHVMAKRLFDLSHLVHGYGERSRDFH
ncbi:MAG TPA: hypothetical protein VEA69_02515, partial [Tepidisphaeraceae bacterium]|nr:hypothetical protein [Tepidisphaeraceae bacterium]